MKCMHVYMTGVNSIASHFWIPLSLQPQIIAAVLGAIDAAAPKSSCRLGSPEKVSPKAEDRDMLIFLKEE
jgi:hypothetical protein